MSPYSVAWALVPWTTLNVFPPRVIVPDRTPPVLFDETVKLRFPIVKLPSVIQDALAVGVVTEHPLAMEIVTLPAPPLTPNDLVAGERTAAQGSPIVNPPLTGPATGEPSLNCSFCHVNGLVPLCVAETLKTRFNSFPEPAKGLVPNAATNR